MGVDVGHGWSMLVRDVGASGLLVIFDCCSSTNGNSSASKTWCLGLSISMRGLVHEVNGYTRRYAKPTGKSEIGSSLAVVPCCLGGVGVDPLVHPSLIETGDQN